MFQKLFLSHPRSIGESYGSHFIHACSFSAALIGAGLACFIHALVPGVFIRAGSRTVTRLYDRMVLNRAQKSDIYPTSIDQ